MINQNQFEGGYQLNICCHTRTLFQAIQRFPKTDDEAAGVGLKIEGFWRREYTWVIGGLIGTEARAVKIGVGAEVGTGKETV